jgi:hypothetical protein
MMLHCSFENKTELGRRLGLLLLLLLLLLPAAGCRLPRLLLLLLPPDPLPLPLLLAAFRVFPEFKPSLGFHRRKLSQNKTDFSSTMYLRSAEKVESSLNR